MEAFRAGGGVERYPSLAGSFSAQTHDLACDRRGHIHQLGAALDEGAQERLQK